MRIAVFADNHGNPYSTRAVLKAISDVGLFDAVVAAGDVCSGGSDPAACVDMLQAAEVQMVYGNADEFVFASPKEPPAEIYRARWNQIARNSRWAAEELGEDRVNWLRERPFELRFSPTDNTWDDLLIVHANPKDVYTHVFPPEEIQRELLGEMHQPDDEAIRLTPDYAEAYINRGWAYRQKGDLDRAIVDYSEAIRLAPNDGRAYQYRGRAYANKKDWVQAITDCSQALSFDQADAQAHNCLAVAYGLKGEYDRAITHGTRAIELGHDPPSWPYLNRGVAYHQNGEYERALADYDQVLRLEPDSADAYNNRGYTYIAIQEYDKAIADFDQAIRLDPDFASAYRNRGFAYGLQGNYEQAIADFDETLRLYPDDPLTYFRRGIAYMQIGDKDHVIADLEKYLEIGNNPQNRQLAEEHIRALRGD